MCAAFEMEANPTAGGGRDAYERKISCGTGSGGRKSTPEGGRVSVNRPRFGAEELRSRGGAAFERPLPNVQLAEPDTRTVAPAFQHRLHQFRWRPLERVRCPSLEAYLVSVEQVVMEVAQNGEIPRLVADAVALEPNVMHVELRSGTARGVRAFPAVSFQNERAYPLVAWIVTERRGPWKDGLILV